MLAYSSWPRTESPENKRFITKSVELGRFGDHQTDFSQMIISLHSSGRFNQTSEELAHLVEKHLLKPHDPLRPNNLTESTDKNF